MSELPPPVASGSAHPLATERQAHIDASTLPEGMSKNAAKKAARRAYYEATKATRRQAEKERRKAKAKSQPPTQPQPQPQQRKVRRAVGARLLIDLAFDELMSEKEHTSLAQQIMYVYAANRGSSAPFDRLVLTGPDAPDADLLSSAVGRAMQGKLRGVWHSWARVDLHRLGGLPSLTRDPHRKLIYLTADTENTLASLDDDTTYILGGIVDKNRHKSLCLHRAQRLGIPVAKLPITDANLAQLETRLRTQGKTAAFHGRKVLTVNQVAEILLGWNETKDWVEAIGRGLPQRKFDQHQHKGKELADPPSEAEQDHQQPHGDD